MAPPHIAHACLYVYISSISFIFLRAGVQDVKFLNKEQESEAKHFKDPATNIDLDVTDKVGCTLLVRLWGWVTAMSDSEPCCLATKAGLDATDKVWCAAPPAAAALHRVLHASL